MAGERAPAPKTSTLEEYVRWAQPFVTRLERNWALSAALILAAIIVVSVL